MSNVEPDRDIRIAIRGYVPPHAPTSNFTVEGEKPDKKTRGRSLSKGLGDWTLIYDTETSTDINQQLKFGNAQLRCFDKLRRVILFYDPLSLSAVELSTLLAAAKHPVEEEGKIVDIEVMTVTEFVEQILLPYGYDQKATIVFANGHFDVSRISIGYKATDDDGFRYKLLENNYDPTIVVKNLGGKKQSYRFSPCQRGIAKRDKINPKTGRLAFKGYRGNFADVLMIARATLSEGFNLKRLADHLNVVTRKADTEDHGRITPDYIRYSLVDTQCTWECYRKLLDRYEQYGLSSTAFTAIFSEASVGKAAVKQANIVPWQKLQPDFPEGIIGKAMQSYFGGRTECHLHKQIAEVTHFDYLSEYPTVNAKMGLDRYLVSAGLDYDTNVGPDVQRLLIKAAKSGVAFVQDNDAWLDWVAIVEVLPDRDIFPVRAEYDEGSFTIGFNYLISKVPLYYTLNHCIASAILTGKPPRVKSAIRFLPKELQREVRPISLNGRVIDPRDGRIYATLIETRSEIKAEMSRIKRQLELTPTNYPNRAALERKFFALGNDQLFLKIWANSAGYGIYLELNDDPIPYTRKIDGVRRYVNRKRICYSGNVSFECRPEKDEKPGPYFHPILGTMITSGGHLLLAAAEKVALDMGRRASYFDTDSLFPVKPEAMSREKQYETDARMMAFFQKMSPYNNDEPLLKLEDTNFSIEDNARREPLYILSISSKRYVLFNIDPVGKPIIRKASNHGLGMYISPYQGLGIEKGDVAGNSYSIDPTIPEPHCGWKLCQRVLGCPRWVHDVWYMIIVAHLASDMGLYQNWLYSRPEFLRPARGSATISTPDVQAWFSTYNAVKSYREQVRPANFFNVYQFSGPWNSRDERGMSETERSEWEILKGIEPSPTAPFSTNPIISKADIKGLFDRKTGYVIDPGWVTLLSYADRVSGHPDRPENKFIGGRGPGWLTRRVVVTGDDPMDTNRYVYIGKRTNNLIRNIIDGTDETKEYTPTVSKTRRSQEGVIYDKILMQMLTATQQPKFPAQMEYVSQRELAKEFGISQSYFRDLINGSRPLTVEMRARVAEYIDDYLLSPMGEPVDGDPLWRHDDRADHWAIAWYLKTFKKPRPTVGGSILWELSPLEMPTYQESLDAVEGRLGFVEEENIPQQDGRKFNGQILEIVSNAELSIENLAAGGSIPIDDDEELDASELE